MTILALSIHCVFEGLAIGLEKNVHDVWILFAAVAAHKFVISFCIGLELYQAKTPKILFVSYIIIFALVTPIGMGIGIAISTLQVSSGYYVSVAVLQGIAGGTILYIVVFEVLERERSKNVSGLAQLLFISLGFAVISSIEFLNVLFSCQNISIISLFTSTFDSAKLSSVVLFTFLFFWFFLF